MKPIRMDVHTPDGVVTSYHETLKNAKRQHNRLMKKYNCKLKRLFYSAFMILMLFSSVQAQSDRQVIFVDHLKDGSFEITQYGHDEPFKLCLRFRRYFSTQGRDIKERFFDMQPVRVQSIPFSVTDLESGTYSLDWSTSEDVFDFMVIEYSSDSEYKDP